MILILLFAIIILIVYAIYISRKDIVYFNKENKKLIEYDDMPHIRFDPFPNTVDINNTHDCNIYNLRKCSMDDQSTLFGCRELLVECVHFTKDIEFEDGKIVVPKNANSNEGYALVVDNVDQACNAYHGDLVVVSTSNSSNDYRFICKCKYNGYIGNDTLDGSCTTVTVCNGKIDNIDQPLEKIKCICKQSEINVRYFDLVPTCKTMTILEANKRYKDWHTLINFDMNKQHLIDVSNTVPEIRQNFNCKYILDPTKHSFHDTSLVLKDNVYFNNHCVARGAGVPVNLGILNPNTQLDENHDLYMNHVDGIYWTEPYSRVRITKISGQLLLTVTAKTSIHKTGRRELTIFVGKKLYVSTTDFAHVNMVQIEDERLFTPRCWAHGVSAYDCNCAVVYLKISKSNAALKYIHDDPPSLYWWGTDLWEKVQDSCTGINGTTKEIELHDKYFLDNCLVFGYVIKNNKPTNDPIDQGSGVLTFKNKKNYDFFKSRGGGSSMSTLK